MKRVKKILRISLMSLECLRIVKISDDATIPSRATPDSIGYDLHSARDSFVKAHGQSTIPTDLQIGIPSGHYGRVAPRSGLTVKHFIDVGAGVIDPGYRGPLGVVLFNHSDIDFPIKKGDRIAQLILERASMVDVIEVKNLDQTFRNEKGFGSTGK